MGKKELIIKKCQKCGANPTEKELIPGGELGKATIYPDRDGFGGKNVHSHKGCGGRVEVEARPEK